MADDPDILYCANCGKLGHLAGRCSADPLGNGALPNKPSPLPNSKPAPLPNGTSHKATAPKQPPLTVGERQARWRATHQAEHRSYMQTYMKRRRA